MAEGKMKVYQITVSKYSNVSATDVLLGNIQVGYAHIGDHGNLEDAFMLAGFPFIVSEKIIEVPVGTPMSLTDPKPGKSELMKPSLN